MRSSRTVKAAKFGYILTSIVLCGAGIFLMIRPGFSARLFCRIAGTLLAVCGIIKLIGYFSRDLYRLAFQFDLAFGILSTVLGLILLLHTDGVMLVLHVIIGVLALADGLFKFQTALDARRFGLARWWIIAVMSMISAVFGLLLVADPFAGTVVLMTMMGLTFFAEGILNLCVAICAVKIIENKKEERE